MDVTIYIGAKQRLDTHSVIESIMELSQNFCSSKFGPRSIKRKMFQAEKFGQLQICIYKSKAKQYYPTKHAEGLSCLMTKDSKNTTILTMSKS